VAITFLRNGKVETDISFQGLDSDSNRLANIFKEKGVEKGDRVILFFPKCVFFVTAHLAIQKIGAITVSLNPGFKKSEMTYLVNDSKAKLILCESHHEDMIKEIDPNSKTIAIDTQKRYQDLDFFRSASREFTPVDLSPEDPAVIIYTSGTTAHPKGAVLTNKNLVNDAKNIIGAWEICDSDVLCHSIPLFHIHGLCFALHTCLTAGTRMVMLDQFSPESVSKVLSEKEGKCCCNMFMAVPSIYSKLMAHLEGKDTDFNHLRLLTSGSAPLLPKDFDRIAKTFGQQPVEREGMSESGVNFSNPLRGVKKPGSIGLPLPDLQVRLVDPKTCKDVEPGQTGEIWLKGPCIMHRYWQKPEETTQAFQDGWFRTGDLGNVDDEGYYYLTDRIKHIIISGGENISPKEIEATINKLDDVVDSTVVGIPDEQWGEKVVAAVVLKPESHLDAHDIKKFCKENLQRWKCPKEVIFIKELPKNTMGKVLKEEIKKMF
jgi:malonyl-CoA/methylmalonyl-CoA synthetase